MTSDLRDSYFDCLLDEMNRHEESILLSVDMGAKSFSQPEKRRNARIINCGVSEANAVSVAAGLSSRGVKAFVYGISSFLMNRPRAQIRHDAVIGNNPVHLIGSGPGLAYDRDGPSHHSLDDIALARTLPNFLVYSPFDKATAERAVKSAMTTKATTYCRLDKGSYPDVAGQFTEHAGIYARLADKTKWLVCSGIQTHIAMKQAAEGGQSIASLFEIGPQTVDEVGRLIPRGASVTVLDETHESGGVFQLVGEANLIHKLDLTLTARGLKNKFVQEKLNRDKLYQAYMQ
jgi:transketolase